MESDKRDQPRAASSADSDDVPLAAPMLGDPAGGDPAAGDGSPSATPGRGVPQRTGLLRSGLVVGMMTMLSRVLGLARDVTIATLFGAGSGADAPSP